MTTYITFQGGNGGAGGGGGSGPVSPANNSEQNSSQGNAGPGLSDPRPRPPMLYVRRESLNFDIGPVYNSGKGYITTIASSPMPKRLLLTANCYYYGGGDNYKFSFIVDALLVPLSFYAQSCFDLYSDPYNPEGRGWYMGTRRLRDDIILLRRFAVQGDYLTCAAEHVDIPEAIRKRRDYRLVITCPTFHEATGVNARGLYVQVEMEF
ncbi:hypothetical protein BC827DRAFT_1377673 [Russula dissimulans]|nr:hypothetical protein BC827DRAFT_1377673 [Russula dissimulans]